MTGQLAQLPQLQRPDNQLSCRNFSQHTVANSYLYRHTRHYIAGQTDQPNSRKTLSIEEE
jgi:hypothetical protein